MVGETERVSSYEKENGGHVGQSGVAPSVVYAWRRTESRLGTSEPKNGKEEGGGNELH